MTAVEAVPARSTQASDERKTAVFTALSDPIRRGIIERLAQTGPMNVGDLSAPFTVSAPAISRHLRVLEAAGIVVRTVDRQWRVCSLEPTELVHVRSWLDGILPRT